jgi:high-affinity iron transporter
MRYRYQVDSVQYPIMRSMSLYRAAAILVLLLAARWGIAAEPTTQDAARQTWQLLDYVAVDYAGAVSANGKVDKPSEY